MTSDQQLRSELRKLLRAQQIIVAAMAAGVFVFLMVAVASGPLGGAADSEPDTAALGGLSMVAVAATLAALLARAVVPSLVVRTQRRRIHRGQWQPSTETPAGAMLAKLGTDGALMMLHQLRVIVGSALIEAAAFLAIIAFFIERSLVAAALAVGLAAVLFVQFPTERRVAAWLAEQRRLLEEEKLLDQSSADT